MPMARAMPMTSMICRSTSVKDVTMRITPTIVPLYRMAQDTARMCSPVLGSWPDQETGLPSVLWSASSISGVPG